MYKPFRINRASGGFRLLTISENGRTLNSSEVYTRKRACITNVKAVAKFYFSALPPEKIINYIEDTTLKPKL